MTIKTKAFSIIEVLITMVIAAIILGVTFTIFTIISERLLDYKNQNQLVNDLNRFTYSFNKDIFDNDELFAIDDELTFKNYNNTVTKYFFEENSIIRDKQDFIDTFKITLKHYQSDTVKTKNQKLIFERIKMKISADSVILDLNFYKPIYANEILAKRK